MTSRTHRREVPVVDDPNAQNDPTARVPLPDAAPPAPSVAPPPSAAPPPPSWEASQKRRDDGTPIASIIVGLILIGIGLWFFLEHTLGIDMPDLRWSQLWPVILIVVGAVVLIGARRDRR